MYLELKCIFTIGSITAITIFNIKEISLIERNLKVISLHVYHSNVLFDLTCNTVTCANKINKQCKNGLRIPPPYKIRDIQKHMFERVTQVLNEIIFSFKGLNSIKVKREVEMILIIS